MGCSAVVSNTSCGVAKAQGNKRRFGAEREYQAQGTTPCHDTKGHFRFTMGRSSVRLERTPDTGDVGGSIPSVPTTAL